MTTEEKKVVDVNIDFRTLLEIEELIESMKWHNKGLIHHTVVDMLLENGLNEHEAEEWLEAK